MPAVSIESPSFDVEFFGLTDRGLQRSNNEDNLAIANLTTGETRLPTRAEQQHIGPRGALFLVCDGMGGEQAGEVASRMCAELVPKKLQEFLNAAPGVDEPTFLRALDRAIQLANARIYEEAEFNTRERGMGCTLTAAAVLGRRLLVAQVGDSRAYLVRGTEIKQLTEDQTLGNYLASLNPAAASEIAPQSHNILTQAVGATTTLVARITAVELSSGDRLLVCSDGLYNMVSNDEIFEALTRTKTVLDAAHELVRRANAGGGSDNITVIVARFQLPGQSPPDPLPPIHCVEISLAE